MRIVWFLADLPKEDNTSRYRIFTPAKKLARAGHHCHVTHIGEIIQNEMSPETAVEVGSADVIVMERLLMKETHSFIRDQVALGKKVWATFDDAYHLMPGSVSRDTWRGGKGAVQGRGSILNEFRVGLRLVTGYMTPSRLLTDAYSMYNKNGQFVPNYLDEDLWSNLPERNPNIITIGWGGTSMHNRSWLDSDIIPALGAICGKANNIVVHIQPPYPDVISRMESYGVRYQIGTWQPFEEWPKTIAKFHVGVAPLDGGRYDAHRSNLKCLEFAYAGIPWAATDAEPYQGCKGGILVNNDKRGGWYRALSEILQNKRVDNNEMAEEGRRWAVKENSKCVERYEEVLCE